MIGSGCKFSFFLISGGTATFTFSVSGQVRDLNFGDIMVKKNTTAIKKCHQK
jgi:hypothetical protein